MLPGIRYHKEMILKHRTQSSYITVIDMYQTQSECLHKLEQHINQIVVNDIKCIFSNFVNELNFSKAVFQEKMYSISLVHILKMVYHSTLYQILEHIADHCLQILPVADALLKILMSFRKCIGVLNYLKIYTPKQMYGIGPFFKSVIN